MTSLHGCKLNVLKLTALCLQSCELGNISAYADLRVKGHADLRVKGQAPLDTGRYVHMQSGSQIPAQSDDAEIRC